MFQHVAGMFLAPDVVVPPLVIGVILFWVTYWYLKRNRGYALVKPGIGTSDWVTVGGRKSKIYYDIDEACSDLDGLERINRWYIDNIREITSKVAVDRLAFIEREDGPVGAITKKDKVSSELGIPSFIVRPRKRIRAARLKGASRKELPGKKVVIVSDVTTTGHSAQEVIDILETHGARVVGVVTVVFRGEATAKDLFKGKSIEFRYAEEEKNLRHYLPSQEQPTV